VKSERVSIDVVEGRRERESSLHSQWEESRTKEENEMNNACNGAFHRLSYTFGEYSNTLLYAYRDPRDGDG